MTKSRHPHINFLRRHPSRQKSSSRRKRWLIGIGGFLGLGCIAYVGVLAAGFFAVKYHLTDEPGTVDPQSKAYETLSRSLWNIPADQLHLPNIDTREDGLRKLAAAQDDCQLRAVQQAFPINAAHIAAAQAAKANHITISKMVFAVRLRAGDPALNEALDTCLVSTSATPPTTIQTRTTNVFPWANSEEWQIASVGFRKDSGAIASASTVTGVEARMIAATGFVEQMRLYFTQREIYERFFRPLKVLGAATQFAWGVMAIKEATAIDVERHLQTPSSVYYLGANREHALDFSSADQTKERYNRLTDEKNHLFSYLYGGFELAQFRAQWKRAGFPIDDRPEILATLYNIGFGRSKPNDHPAVGGSTITIADTEYTFGALAFEFYYSGELSDIFPYRLETGVGESTTKQ